MRHQINDDFIQKPKIMKRYLFLITVFAIIGFNGAFAQSKLTAAFVHKSRQALPKAGCQNEWLSPFNEQTSYNPAAKSMTGLHPKSYFALDDSVYNWLWGSTTWAQTPDLKSTHLVYDSRYNLTNELWKYWNDTTWANDYQDSYTYDAHNNETSDTNKYWNYHTWVNQSLNIFTYDAHNNQTSWALQEWNGSAWVYTTRETFTFDSLNNQTSWSNQNWVGANWVVESRDTSLLTYNGNSEVTNALVKIWDTIHWVNSYQYTYTYNANHYVIQRLKQSWNGTAWTYALKDTCTYNHDNFMTRELEKKWNGHTWILSWEDRNTYDSYDLKIGYSEISWNSAGTVITSGDSNYYYYHSVLGINELTAQPVSIVIYPNPATDNLTIETSQQADIEILNIEGQLIKSVSRQTASGNKTNVNVSDLPCGVYFIEVKTEKGVAIKKFIKE